MIKQLPLLLTILSISIMGSIGAQSRQGSVLNTFGNGDGDRFGATVSLSDDGTRLAVMAPDNGMLGTGSPQAEVYELQGANWVKLGNTFTDYFTSPGNAEATIVMSGSGTTVATGEPAYNTVDDFDAGRIVAYRYGTGAWNTIANELTGTYANARLGKKIALIENGAQLMTANFDGAASDPRGAFNLVQGAQWTTVGTQPILQSNNEISVTGIALGQDGLRIAIGLNKGATSAGEVQLYRFSGDWVSLGNLNGTGVGDGFGESIALAENGETIIVGAPNHDAGKVRVYDGTNTQKGSTLEAINDDRDFGYSVDISEDGSRIAIGAPANTPAIDGPGRVYVYDFIGGDWALQYTFEGSVDGEHAGQSISLSKDGLYLAIGRPGYQTTGQSDAGQVDVYALDGSSATREKYSLALNVFPNPTSSLLRIEGLPEGNSTLLVRDAIGRTMMTAKTQGQFVDVSSLAKGYYLLEVNSKQGIGRVPFVKK